MGKAKIEPFLSFLFTQRNPAFSEWSDKQTSAPFSETSAKETKGVECHLLISHSVKCFQGVVNHYHLLHIPFAHYLCSLLELGCGCP